MNLATVTLAVEILFYLVLCAGVVAQLRGLYKWHDRLQAPVVILNIFFIIFVMIPTFRLVVFEQLPGGLSDVPTLVTAAHGLLGSIAQLLSIYVLLAGFKILPRKIGVLRYWMWTTFGFWTLTILFGVAVYMQYYTGDSSAGGEAVAEHDADLVAVEEGITPDVSEEAAPVAEHDEAEVESLPAEETPAEPTAELVAEHDAEEAVVEPPAEPVESEPALEAVAEHDADLAEPAEPVAAVETDETELLVDEHAEAGAAVVEPEYTGEVSFVAWEQLNPTSAETPGVRYEQAMQYNEAVDRVFVFGGRDGSQVFNDVWVLEVDNVVWQQLGVNSPTAPPARYSATMIVDEAGQNLYVTAGQAQGGQTFNDIWRFDLVNEVWEDLTPTAGPPPAARYGSPGGNLGDNLVFTHGFGETRYDDTWRFNTATRQWENITPPGTLPLKRCLFAAAPSGQNLAIHGGCAAPFGDCYLNDTWLFDTTAKAWREVLSEVKPAGRQHHSLVEVTGRDRFILYGGEDASQTARDDIWLLDLATGTWSLADSELKPPARFNHSAVWIPSRSAMLIFGGRNETGGLDDLWFGTF